MLYGSGDLMYAWCNWKEHTDLGTSSTFQSNKNIITDLINTLPGNSPVNAVQPATVEEAVFSMSAVTSQQSIVITWHVFSVDPNDAPVGWLDSDHVICVNCRFMSFPQQYDESSELQVQSEFGLGVLKSIRGQPVKTSCAIWCAIVQWYWQCVWFDVL
jgi:hypothetical protein